MPQKRPLVSIVCPFFNEAANIGPFHQALLSELDQLPQYRFELLCVDDGSEDSTLDQLIVIAQADRRFKVMELARNFGKEAALSAGLEAAQGDLVLTIDTDLQDPVDLVGRLIGAWQDNRVDVVLARRSDRSNDSVAKRVSAKAYYKLHNYLSPVKIPEDVGDCRLMTRQVVQSLLRLPETQRFMKGLFAWVGYKTMTIEYRRDARYAGDSKFSVWRLWNFGLDGITSFSTTPLRVWTYIGITGALFSLGFGIYVILRTLFFGTDVPGYASLFVAILFFGSVQLIGLGILGEYVGRLFLESKRRPIYLVRQVHGADDPPDDSSDDTRLKV
jgi:polyisoprenyl-phosphate glycosyltransferase